MTQTFGSGTFGSPTATFDGGATDGVELTVPDNAYTPVISKDASYVPTYSKVGTP